MLWQSDVVHDRLADICIVMAHDEAVATQGNTASSPKVVISDIVAVFCFRKVRFDTTEYWLIIPVETWFLLKSRS
jgi:hypothetical protein